MFLGMSIGTIVTQTIALFCNTYTAFSKKTKNVYIANCLFNIFAMLTGLLQGDYGTCVSYLIIIYRSIATIYKDKVSSKISWFPYTFVVLHILFGIVTWKDYWSIIPTVTPIITGLVMWYSNNLQVYRGNNILNNLLWFIHNVHSKSYILCITRVYAIGVNVVALVKRRKVVGE